MSRLETSFEFCAVDGKLAVRGPAMADWSEPKQTTNYWISNACLDRRGNGQYRWWIGARSYAVEGNAVHFYQDGRYMTAQTDDADIWTVRQETQAVKAPGRGSKYFQWVWESGRWQKRAR